ncbi:hypothetical protein C0Q70_13073 [Pomacea canaliculata]|uniref:Uncharacterized protein n=1 Tax=Pomacea canaliculata TaxID=400727 RepID=A0A2T7NW81_POMCA|nr:hypothetical protein C0Q70_13073 [Pomacea canaliculata]
MASTGDQSSCTESVVHLCAPVTCVYLCAPVTCVQQEVRLAEYAAQSQRLIHDIRMARTSEQSQRAIQQLEKLHADVQDVVQQVLQQNNKLRQRTHKQTRLLKMQDKSLKSWRSLCQN